MNNEEYNKILQLVKSDCPNNRLLGFQLAKGLGYDLSTLMRILNSIEKVEELDLIIIVGNFKLKYSYKFMDVLGWSFRIYKDGDEFENIKYKIQLQSGLFCNNPEWDKTFNNVKQEFINLIINE